MPSPHALWTRPEMLLALHLYTRIPFGRQHARAPEVRSLAVALGRTPSSVARRLNNFTAVDPAEMGRVKGLKNTSKLLRQVFSEFLARPADIAAEAEALWQARFEPPSPTPNNEPTAPERIEATSQQRVRLAQSFFRRVVLANFDGRCALTGITHPALVNASHIVGWAEHDGHRVNPRNGIALNRLHDAAFDRKLITFDESLRLVVGRQLRESLPAGELATGFLAYEGRALSRHMRHALDASLLEQHRDAFTATNR